MRRMLGLIPLTVIIGWLISVFAPSFVSAQQPPGDSCRPVSKIEYNAAKAEYLLMGRSRVYVQTGHFGGNTTGIAPCSGGGNDGAVADRGPFGL
jgi:hypothetical protein